ncbi:hypothetical protein SHIRM173S_09653 [Streptomyces hirsutus]
MLKAMCQIASCVNIEVTRRYHSPWAKALGGMERRRGPDPDQHEMAQQRRPDMHRDEHRGIDPEESLVTSRGSAAMVPPAIVRGMEAVGAWPVPEPPRTHSGHWKPTEALIMHSGQIGRSQRVQRMPVSRSGWR